MIWCPTVPDETSVLSWLLGFLRAVKVVMRLLDPVLYKHFRYIRLFHGQVLRLVTRRYVNIKDDEITDDKQAAETSERDWWRYP